jgi:hypothetical protein
MHSSNPPAHVIPLRRDAIRPPPAEERRPSDTHRMDWEAIKKALAAGGDVPRVAEDLDEDDPPKNDPPRAA